MLIVVVLFITVLLRVGIVAVVVYLMLPATRACPRCGDEALLIRHAVLRYVVATLEHRWCLKCGWSGVVRRISRSGRVPQSRVINRAARS